METNDEVHGIPVSRFCRCTALGRGQGAGDDRALLCWSEDQECQDSERNRKPAEQHDVLVAQAKPEPASI